jgi:ZIP family zinc transporter
MRFDNFLIASGLTLLAGLSTGIGGLITFFSQRTHTKLLSVILGFSAGVMIYVSFIEIFPEAKKHLVLQLGEKAGLWVTVAAFFGGIFLIAMIDKLIPSGSNPHESHKIEEMDQCEIKKSRKLLKTGILTASAVIIHNFPEGLATFTAALQKPSLGVVIATAIAIHRASLKSQEPI